MSIDGSWRLGARIVRTQNITVGAYYYLRNGDLVKITELSPVKPDDDKYPEHTFKGTFADGGGFCQWHQNGIFICSSGERENGFDIVGARDGEPESS